MTPQNEQLSLFDQLTYYEGPDIEYKSAAGGLPGDLWETYSAFANTDGGGIWLGVKQRADGTLEPHGVESPEKMRQDFWNLVNNRGKISHNLLTETSVRILPLPSGGRSLIRIDVSRASRFQRPVFVGQNPFKGTYRRNAEGDYLCTEDEVRRMFADQSQQPADSRLLRGFGIDDIHLDSLRQYRNRFASRSPNHPWLSEDDKGFLGKLEGWRRDRDSGIEGPTLAGMLMFGREQAIREPDVAPGFHLDYREHYSSDPEIRWTDRITIDGTWEGNVFQFYQQVILKLSGGPGVQSPFQVDSEGYRRASTSTHEALQEALVNALIHADYAGQGGIVIDRYQDRIEFSNPGTLLVSHEQILKGGVSECRNKSLQKMFQMMGAGDKAGSGVDKIRRSWMERHWQAPRLSESTQPDRVQLLLPMISTLPKDIMDRLDARFGDLFRALGGQEVQILVTAEQEGEVSNQRLQEMLPLHPADITRLLRSLVDKGMLNPLGNRRSARYLPVDAAPQVDPLPEDGEGRPPDDGTSIPHKGEGIPHKGTSTPDKGVSNPDKGVSPSATQHGGLSAAEEERQGVEKLPAELWEIAAPIRNRPRAEVAQVRETILALCSGRYLSLQQLSQLLGRAPDALSQHYLTPMLREDLLVLRYPDARKHPMQAYAARDLQSDVMGERE
jgi:ATP-dependent DNA helicase RecG